MRTAIPATSGRRAFLRCSSFWLASTAAAGAGAAAALARAADPPKREKERPEVGPTEDLMREHGVVLRVLAIYGEVLRRLDTAPEVAQPLAETTQLVRAFIEDYHEKQEEDFLFPRFRQAGRLTSLVDTLQQQHQAGRRITETVLRLANPAGLQDEANRRELGDALRSFGHMYVPHAGYEDTVLFPAVREIISPHEFKKLGDTFEHREHQLFGEEGFERQVERLAAIEKSIGITDLSQFTPT